MVMILCDLHHKLLTQRRLFIRSNLNDSAVIKVPIEENLFANNFAEKVQ